jgi:zinc-binding in reverse transcriptase
MTSTASELSWIKQVLTDLNFEINRPIKIFCDNQSARHIAANIPPLQETSISTTKSSFFIRDTTKLQSLMNAVTERNDQGQLLWNLTAKKIFTVQSTYVFINDPGIPNPILQNIWKLHLPPIIKIFLWLLLPDILQIATNLQKKRWPAIAHCVMCSAQAQESGNHLFAACATAKALTQQVFGWATRTTVITVQDI